MPTKKKDKPMTTKEKQGIMENPLHVIGGIHCRRYSNSGVEVCFTIKQKEFREVCPKDACNDDGVPKNIWLRQFIAKNIQDL